MLTGSLARSLLEEASASPRKLARVFIVVEEGSGIVFDCRQSELSEGRVGCVDRLCKVGCVDRLCKVILLRRGSSRMVWLPIGRREDDSVKPGLLTLPTSVITDSISIYLNLVELTRLASLCRSLRTTLRSNLRSENYLIGDTLFARAALASGVPHYLQNRS